MKSLLKIISATVIVMLMLNFQPASAQSEIDTNRMNRDINIMENVLGELFKTQWSASGNNIRIQTGSFPFSPDTDINGTFLPDYGIIFTIPGGPPGFAMMDNSDDEDFDYTFQYGDDTNGEKVTEESVTTKIIEFLRDYGSTIGQLSDRHKVMVIYKTNQPPRGFTFFRFSDEDEKAMRQPLPTISVAASAANLKAYRSGDLSDGDFRNQLEIQSIDSAAKAKDLKVMAGILETAFEDSDEKQFHIRGHVDYLKLDNFGAMFSFDARYSRSGFDFSNLQISLDATNEKLEKARKQLEKVKVQLDEDFEIDEDFDIDFDHDSVRTQHKKEAEEKRNKEKEAINKAYQQFLNDLKTTIADYGMTLHSVDSNEQILISVALNSRYDSIPDRVDLQVQKSALENSSADEATSQITVREY